MREEMRAFFEPFETLEEMRELRRDLRDGGAFYAVLGCIDPAKAQLIYGLGDGYLVRLVVTRDEKRARQLAEELEFFTENVFYYPAKDLLFYQSDIRSNVLTRQRMQAVEALRGKEETVIVTTWSALMNKLPPLSSYDKNIIEVAQGDDMPVEKWRLALIGSGYEPVARVEHPGEFAVRGGIIDVFPLTDANPIRIELWGDEVDTMRLFDPDSQLSLSDEDPLRTIRIVPSAEIVLSSEELRRGLAGIRADADRVCAGYRESFKTEEAARIKAAADQIIEDVEGGFGSQQVESHLTYFTDQTLSLIDYIPEDGVIFLDGFQELMESGKVIMEEFSDSMTRRLEEGYILPGQMQMLYDNESLTAKLRGRRGVLLSALEGRDQGLEVREHFHIRIRQGSVYNNSYELLLKDLREYKKNRRKLVYVGNSRTRARRLADDLLQENLNVFYTEDPEHEVKEAEIMVTRGSLSAGYELTDAGFVLLTEEDLFGGRRKRRKRGRRHREGEAIASFAQLHEGDYVVHENHGLGIYRGMEKIEVDQVTKDYIKIEYADSGILYILASQMDLLQKYAGADARRPRLNSLGSQEWSRTKSRVRRAVESVARELVELYAVRQEDKGYAYGPDTVWQREFEEAFPYEETEGQLEAIEAVKKDMESPKIMDRLICGDVGFGKTEIALRAAFKAAQEGKQVVYLVPTTILAQQHYDTFVQRMAPYPIKVGLLCRFRNKTQQAQTVSELASGRVDIVIGTHRALSRDVVFHDLGLLIIDEEQRFGVRHKEKIKQMKKNVDVLSLSATPIPRTLHMSLVGIRDMSILDEAPMERTPIQTFVFEHNDEMIREAVLREMARGGQIYYVFNRVAQIADMTARLQKLLPEAHVAYAHGRMSQTRLENIMVDFIDGEIDLLVSTTIIEIGLDISNVNTIIIDDADNMGLSQLYQLRGRVGRSNRTAYAFFMYRRGKLLKEVAEKRLLAIKEFSDLGSGFKIAMRDLEIRGAGNVLGESQSGHMESVGYDLYCKMLGEAVRQEKGEEIYEPFETSVDLDMDAYLPESYVADAGQRMEIYKRIADIRSEEDHDAMLEELIDRFGEPARAVQNLLWIALFKARAHRAWIRDIRQKGWQVSLTLFHQAPINPAVIPQLISRYSPYLHFTADPQAPRLELDFGRNSRMEKRQIPEALRSFVEEFREMAVDREA